MAIVVYLGGPINGCSDEEAHGWREAVKVLLRAAGLDWRDPMDRDYRGREMEPGIAKLIVEGDKEDIAPSDILLMNHPQPSSGTDMEILLGFQGGKEVDVVIPDDGRAPSPWVVYHASRIFRGSVIEAAKILIAEHQLS
jgi:hypothetical protein